MGPVNDQYIHYKKACNQFSGRSITCISSPTMDFTMSPCYFELQNAPVGTEEQIDNKIVENIVCKHKLKPQLFNIICSLYTTLCFHHDFLAEFLHLHSSL